MKNMDKSLGDNREYLTFDKKHYIFPKPKKEIKIGDNIN